MVILYVFNQYVFTPRERNDMGYRYLSIEVDSRLPIDLRVSCDSESWLRSAREQR